MGGGQSLTSAVKLAATLARQWMGVHISPEAVDDGMPPPLPPPLPLPPPSPPSRISHLAPTLAEWLVDGLSGALTHVFVKRFLGSNEHLFRLWQVRASSTCQAA